MAQVSAERVARPAFDQAAAWDLISASYQERSQIPTADLYYGPWAPPESELQLLGDLRGGQVLDLGCGGGQSAIWLAQQGASVTGLDISQQQLAFATSQARQAGVAVRFVQGGAEQLASWPPASWDLILSIYALPYIVDLTGCLAACQRTLRTGGRLIFSLDHPIRTCFFDPVDQELTLFPGQSYFDTTPRRWFFPEAHVPMQSYHYTISQWVDLLHGAGLRLLRLIEPVLPDEVLRELWPDDDPLSSMRNLPQTLIVCAEKL